MSEKPNYYIDKDGQPYYSNGQKYKHWDYEKMKTFNFSPESAHVPMTFPEPVEIADHVPSLHELEKIKKAEEKRMRKRMKGLDRMARMLFGKEDETLNPSMEA